MQSHEKEACVSRGLDPCGSGAAAALGPGRVYVEGDPRLVTRGETDRPNEEASKESAFIDWLAFTIKPTEADQLGWLQHELRRLFGVAPTQYKPLATGWQGYEHRINIGALGLLAYGGQHQRDTIHVSFNSHGCANVTDWDAVRQWGEGHGAWITRSDLAHDDHHGAFVTIERAVEWYLSGGFTHSGRTPQTSVDGDWLGKVKGRTLYIGTREGGKLTRIYEKGRQLGGDAIRYFPNWTRIELELHNKGRVVPWDVLTRPGQYLAGAYPALASLSGVQCRITTTQRAALVTYDAMVRHLRTAGGKLINVMTEVEQGDVAAVVAQLIKPGAVPKRLAGYPDEVLKGITLPKS